MFTCYDHPFIPRTNNDWELFFDEIKRNHRRITGLRHWNRLRHGKHVVLTEEAIKDPYILIRLRAFLYQTYPLEINK
jgi:hypothetical protein